jgi:hypothetical protein
MIRLQVDVVDATKLTVSGTPMQRHEALGFLAMAIYSVLTTQTMNGLDALLVEEENWTAPAPPVDEQLAESLRCGDGRLVETP